MDSLSRGSGRQTPLDTIEESREQERQAKPSLPSAAERKREYGMPEKIAGQPTSTQATKQGAGETRSIAPTQQPESSVEAPKLSSMPQLPKFGGESTFGDEFWGSTSLSESKDSSSASVGTSMRTEDNLQHTPSVGFRSIVNQAFDQPVRSSTGISKHDSQRTESSVSRSDTTGTSDISPIMSRVPSAATTDIRSRDSERRQMATPVIAEEPTEVNVSDVRSHSGETLTSVHQLPQKLSPSRSPNVLSDANSPAFTPGYRRDLSTPSPNNSHARSPAVEANKQLPEPGVAEFAINSPTEQRTAQIGAKSVEESMQSTNTVQPPSFGTVTEQPETRRQDISVQPKDKELPPAPQQTGSRSNSPGKGKVLDMTEKFEADQKNGPIQSTGTPRNASPIKQDTTEPAEPTLMSGPASTTLHSTNPETLERPSVKQELSFRPKFPGQWESFSTSGHDSSKDVIPSALEESSGIADQYMELHKETESAASSPRPPVPTSNDETASNRASDPMTALAATVAAIAGAIITTADPDGTEAESLKSDVENHPNAPDRMQSDMSVTPPLPSDKTALMPEEDDIRPPVPLKEHSKTPIAAGISTEDDSNSDENGQPLPPVDADGDKANRESVIIPPEYESYWASEKEMVPAERSSVALPEISDPNHDQETQIDPKPAPLELVATQEENSGVTRRFSWEADNSLPQTPVSPALAEAMVTALVATNEEITPSEVQDNIPDDPRTSGEGLHTINAEPEEIPQQESTNVPQNDDSPQTVQHVSPVGETPKIDTATVNIQTRDPRLPSFREIMAIKPPEQRIATLNETRVQWAGHDSGLASWVAATVQAHADLGHVSASMTEPSAPPPGSGRHRATSSISRAFTKQFSHPPSQPQPEFVSPQSPTTGPSQGNSPSTTHRISGVKGKDLLQAAGALGGKGMTGAKGLFAKGRNRLRGSTGGSEKVVY
jgi:hypothetical protein